MKLSQKEIWNNIAYDWYELKTNPEKGVLNFLNKKKGNILDFGSGAGRNLIGLHTKGKIFMVDFSKNMIKLARKRAKKLKIKAEFSVSDLKKTPFKNNFFDAAIFIAVLHCIEGEKNREEMVRELFRIMKPKAEAIVAVWNKNSERFRGKFHEKYIAWKDKGERYYYLFEPKEIYYLFQKAGFEIKKKFKPEANIFFIIKKP